MVPDGWRRVTYGEVCTINRENIPPSASPDRTITYLDIGSIPALGRISGDLEQFSFGEAPSRARRVVSHGDVVVSTVRPYLKAFARIIDPPKDLVASTGFAVLTPKERICSEFLFQTVSAHHFVAQLEARMVGSNYPAVNIADVAESTLLLPPLPEQKKIAAILSSVDAAITVTRSVIEQTKRVKKGLLKALVTRGIGHTRFKETAIGEIPEAWEVVRLGDVVEPVFVERPLADDKPYRPVIVRRRHGGVEAPDEKLGSEILVKQQFRPIPGLFLISKRQIIHRACGVIPESIPENATISKEYLQLRATGLLNLEFLDLYSRRPQFYRSIERCTYGVDREKFVLNVPWLLDEPVPLPTLAEQARIVELARLVDHEVEDGQIEIEQLERLKRGLLQDLLTGRVRVQLD